MRIALVLPFPVFGAAESYALVLADGLVARGHEVTLLHHAGCPIPPAEPSSGVQVPIPDAETERIVRLRGRIRSLEPDLVHVNQVHLPSIAGALGARRPRVVVTSHNPALRPRYSIRGRTLARAVLPRVHAWIVLSDRNAELQRRANVGPERIHVIAPGLPPGRTDGAYDRVRARAVLGVPADAFVVGTVGRLAAQKRHDVLIEGGRRVVDAIPGLRIVVIGEGELRAETEALAERSLPGRVVFAGWREDAARLLPAFDVFCLPSDFEGLSFALLEAMASGVPIVATDVQGSGEAIVDGATGILVPAGDAAALAQAIGRVHAAADRGHAMGWRARERFLQRYTADPMIEGTIGVYRAALGR